MAVHAHFGFIRYIYCVSAELSYTGECTKEFTELTYICHRDFKKTCAHEQAIFGNGHLFGPIHQHALALLFIKIICLDGVRSIDHDTLNIILVCVLPLSVLNRE